MRIPVQARRSIYRFVVAALLVLTVLAPAWSFASSDVEKLSAGQQKAVEDIVRKFIMDNPEVLLQSIEAMQARDRQAKAQGVQQTLVQRRQELLNDPGSHVGGNPNGDITLVEFFDYRCGFCKRVHPTVKKLLKDDGNIRFVYKEFPILGPESIYAARAAIASRKQDKYVEYHDALIALRGSFSQDRVLKVAEKVGLDIKKLTADIEAGRAEADKIFTLNFNLADALDINGTPAFVVGSEVIHGAADLEALKQAVAAGRAEKKAKGG